MRAFFCLPLDAGVRDAAARAAERVRREARMTASWVRPENYHVTLRFLGDIEPELTCDLKELAARAASRSEAFSLEIERLGAFPSFDRARVLWAGGETPAAFVALAEELERGLAELKFPREPKPARAHVTLARLKGAPDPRLLDIVASVGSLGAPEYAPREVVLMQSELGSGGARYAPVFAVPLAGRKDPSWDSPTSITQPT